MAEPSIWDYPAIFSRQASRPSGKGWTRVYIFEYIPSVGAEALIPAEFSVRPGDESTNPEVLAKVDFIEQWKPAASGGYYSRVVLYYRPRSFDEWMEANPHKGILYCQAGATGFKQRVVGTDVIDGPDPTDTTGKSRWEVESGTNNVYTYRAIYEVGAVIYDSDTYFFPFVERVGSCNSTTMSNFPLPGVGAAAHQWLLIGLSRVPRPAKERLWNARYRFMFSAATDGWQNPCVSRKWQLKAQEVPILDDLGAEIGTDVSAVWVPTETTDSNILIPEASFATINGMLSSSW